jgi:hypothetical protein
MNTTKTNPKKENDLPKKENDLPVITSQEANEALNEIYLTGSSTKFPNVTEEQFLSILESTPDEGMIEKTSEYFDFDKNTPSRQMQNGDKCYNFIFEGMGTNEFKDPRTGELIEKEVVKISDPKTKQKFIHGASVLVSTCKKLQSMPCFIRVIVAKEKIQGKQGEYLDIRVLTF